MATIDTIKIGSVYHHKEHGYCLVIDKGKFETVEDHRAVPAKIIWRALEVTPSNWYLPMHNSTQRRVVVFCFQNFLMHPSFGVRVVKCVTPQSLDGIPVADETIQRFMADRLLTYKEEITRAKARETDSHMEASLSAVLCRVAKVPYQERYGFHDLVRNKMVATEMLLVWLNYKMQIGHTIDDSDTVEELIDTVVDFRKYLNILGDKKNTRSVDVSKVLEVVVESWTNSDKVNFTFDNPGTNIDSLVKRVSAASPAPVSGGSLAVAS